MTTSPYDSLPSGNNNIPPATTRTVRNVAQSERSSEQTVRNTAQPASSDTHDTKNILPGGRDSEHAVRNVAQSAHDSHVPGDDAFNSFPIEPNDNTVASLTVSDSDDDSTLEYVEVTADELAAMAADTNSESENAQSAPNPEQAVLFSAHPHIQGETHPSHQTHLAPNAVAPAQNSSNAEQTSPHSAHSFAQGERDFAQSERDSEQSELNSAQGERDFAHSALYSARPNAPKPPAAPIKTTKTSPLDTLPQYSHQSIKNLQGCFEYILPFEESLLVPDTMSDMQKVLFAEGRADPAQPAKMSYDINDFLSGDITAYTVYKPAPSQHSSAAGPAAYNNTPVDVVKSTIPFKTDKCWPADSTAGDTFRVKVTLRSITAEMINERKFIIKGELLFNITTIASHELKLFKGSSDNDLITAAESLPVTVLAYETSDSIEISQDITVKEESTTPLRILKTSLDIVETHRHITSGKLVINAAINSQILYVAEKDDGEKKLCCLGNKTDFTQFVAVSESTDPELIHLTFNNDLKITIESSDKFLLQGRVTTLIQAYSNKDLNMVCDAYHKQKELDFDIETQAINSIAETVHGEISAREVATLSDSDKKPETLLCGSCHIARIDGRAEKDRIVIDGSLPVKILALDDEDMPAIIEHTIPVRGALSIKTDIAPAGSICKSSTFTTSSNDFALAGSGDVGSSASICIDAAIKEFWFSEINSRQIEINISLSITVWLENTGSFCTIENLRFAETENSPKRISLAIYVVGSGDTLWTVAKRYKTDVELLAAINEIDPAAPLPVGAKLLIAK